MEKNLFHHKTHVHVRTYEIDWQGIVHNAIYLHYFEVGRIEYLNQIGAKVDINTVNFESKVVVVRNEVDYRNPARLGDAINVYSRVSAIHNTSFVFEGMLERDSTGEILAENVAVHVWLDHKTNAPTLVPNEFRRHVQSFEGKDCIIHWPTITV